MYDIMKSDEDELMRELEELLEDDCYGDNRLRQIVKAVSHQIKCADTYGGYKKIAVAPVRKVSTSLDESKILVTAEESIYIDNGDITGVQTHKVSLNCENRTELAAVYDQLRQYGTYVAIDRRTKTIVGFWA